MFGSRPAHRGLGGDPRPGLGELVDAIGDVVLAEVGQVGAERVRLDRVDPYGEVRVVDAAHDIRTGDVEDLVTALVALEVLQGRIRGLEHGAHGAIGHQNTLG